MVFEKLLKGNVLYYPGCLTKFVLKDIKEKYEKILRKIGIKFIELENINCCGSPLKSTGYFDDFKEIAKKNYEILKRYHVRKIITNCPACYYTFKFEYPKILENWDIEVEHTVQTILNAIRSGKLKLKKVNGTKITYHDPCHLGRYSNIYDEPREILKALGYQIVEMKYNREFSFCCGGGGGVRAYNSNLSRKIAEARISQAKETGAKILVTACPMCYLVLKEASEGIDVKELVELLI